jgi:subtilisin-like proprotein convertase family protein
VSGVIALMLEANSDLTWRDIKHLLVTTSDKVDASKTHTQQGIVQYGWTQNNAGYEHHNWYGFGQINASAAVTAAQSYTANSRGTWASTGYQSSGTLNTSLPDLTVTSNVKSVTKPTGSNDFVEFVRVSIRFDHTLAKSVGVRLTSPDGTTINLMQPYTNVNNPALFDFDIGVSGFYGESIEGNWTIDFADYVGDGVTGTINSWGIEVWGN